MKAPVGMFDDLLLLCADEQNNFSYSNWLDFRDANSNVYACVQLDLYAYMLKSLHMLRDCVCTYIMQGKRFLKNFVLHPKCLRGAVQVKLDFI